MIELLFEKLYLLLENKGDEKEKEKEKEFIIDILEANGYNDDDIFHYIRVMRKFSIIDNIQSNKISYNNLYRIN